MDKAQFSTESETDTLADVEDELDETKANPKNLKQLFESEAPTLEETQKLCAIKTTEQEIAEIVMHLHLELANISAIDNSAAATRPDLEARGDYKPYVNKYLLK